MPLAAISCALGVVVGTRLGAGDGLNLSCLILGAVIVLRALRYHGRALGWFVGLLLMVFGMGAVRGSSLIRGETPPCHVDKHLSRSLSRIELKVIELTADSYGRRRYHTRALALLGPGRFARLCGAVDLYTDTKEPLLFEGDRVQLLGRLRPATPSRNPLIAGAGLRLRSQDIGARFFALAGTALVVEEGNFPALQKFRRLLVAVVKTALADHPQQREIVAALTLGQRQGISEAQRRLFSRAGISHLLAVSGLHMGLVAGFVFLPITWLFARFEWLARRTAPSRIAAIVTAFVLIIYSLITGAAPSTQRACVMIVACLLAHAVGRAPDLGGPLSLAALAVVLWSPALLFQPGFQMSFAAVIGIALFLRRRSTRRESADRLPTISRRLWRWVYDLFWITLVATLCTAPLVAHHFGEVSLWGLLINLVAIPLTSFVILPLGLAGLLVGLFWLGAGAIPLKVAAFGVHLLQLLSTAITGYPGGVVEAFIGWPLTLGLLIVVFGLLRGGKLAVVSVTLGGVLCLVAILLSPIWPTDKLEVTFLDVGQGDSALVRVPSGQAVLIDAGGSGNPSYDPGRRVVLPFLRRLGVAKIDVVVATHPHADHVGGLAALIREVKVGELWLCWHAEENAWVDGLQTLATQFHIPIRRPRPIRFGGTEITPLWPAGDPSACADPLHSTNDNSIVIQMRYGKSAILFAGDVEAASEAQLVSRSAALLRSTVLKVPHHGSKTSSTSAFIDAVQPRYAIISCGVGNRFGFPHVGAIARYFRRSIRVLRTDQLGALQMWLSADGETHWSAPYTPFR